MQNCAAAGGMLPSQMWATTVPHTQGNAHRHLLTAAKSTKKLASPAHA